MVKLFDPSYPFGAKRKELRIGLRAIRLGWLSTADAGSLVEQAVDAMRAGKLDAGDIACLLTAICTYERRRQRMLEAEKLGSLRSRR